MEFFHHSDHRPLQLGLGTGLPLCSSTLDPFAPMGGLTGLIKVNKQFLRSSAIFTFKF